jgi:hypothetical protein
MKGKKEMTPEPKSGKSSGLSDKIGTLPGGWDLSSLPEPASATSSGQSAPASRAEHTPVPEEDARLRTDFQLDPHFDRTAYPCRRDLSSY